MMTKELLVKQGKYLGQCVTTGTMLFVGVVLVLIFGLITTLCTVYLLMLLVSYCTLAPMGHAPEFNSALTYLLYSGMVTALSGLITMVGIGTIRSANRISVENPYVPPIREQIATLPAHKILLRGTAKPSVTPEDLLRASHSASATPADELLRADNGRAE